MGKSLVAVHPVNAGWWDFGLDRRPNDRVAEGALQPLIRAEAAFESARDFPE